MADVATDVSAPALGVCTEASELTQNMLLANSFEVPKPPTVAAQSTSL